MNEDWRLRRAAELFGGAVPDSTEIAVPSSYDHPTDNPADRIGEAVDRRGSIIDRRSSDQPDRRGQVTDPRIGAGSGVRRVDDTAPLTRRAPSWLDGGPSMATVAAPLPPVRRVDAGDAAWPWRWWLLGTFLLAQTALIVWLLVFRTQPVPRIVVVTPSAPGTAVAPAVAPVPVETAPSPLLPAEAPSRAALPPAAVTGATRKEAALDPHRSRAATHSSATATVQPARAAPRQAAKKAAATLPKAASRVRAAAFACTPGAGPAARAVCADPVLRQFDEQAQAAHAAIVAHGDKLLIGVATQNRVRFLKRRDKCNDAACLTRVYTDYIVKLVALLPAGAATPPICMPQEYTRPPLMKCWPSRLRLIRRPFYSK